MSVEYSTRLYFGCLIDDYYISILDIVENSLDSVEEKEKIEGFVEDYIFHLDAWSGEGIFLGDYIPVPRNDEDVISLEAILEAQEKYARNPDPKFIEFELFLKQHFPDFPRSDFYIVNMIY